MDEAGAVYLYFSLDLNFDLCSVVDE